MRKWPGLSETAEHVHHNLWWDLSGNPDKGPRTSLWRHFSVVTVRHFCLWTLEFKCHLWSCSSQTGGVLCSIPAVPQPIIDFFPSHREFVQLSRHWQSWWQDLLPGGPYARSLLTLVRVSWHFICHLCPCYIVLIFFLSYYLLYVSTMFVSNLHFWSWSWE